jgi:MFS superfamily sulfate permease-like transporter
MGLTGYLYLYLDEFCWVVLALFALLLGVLYCVVLYCVRFCSAVLALTALRCIVCVMFGGPSRPTSFGVVCVCVCVCCIRLPVPVAARSKA